MVIKKLPAFDLNYQMQVKSKTSDITQYSKIKNHIRFSSYIALWPPTYFGR